MRELTRDRAEFNWTADCEKEFNDIKKCLAAQPVMAFPDFNKKFILTTDACVEGYGAILSQMYPSGERVVSYASKSTNNSEKNYTASELEAAAVVWAIDKYKLYLTDNPFTLVTDHKALLKFREITGKSAKLERWSLKLRSKLTPTHSLFHSEFRKRRNVVPLLFNCY